MPLSPGESVSSSRYRYTVIQQIGEGGMSTIYLCQCSAPAGSPDAGRWVLKEMTVAYRDQKDQENAVKLFLREAQLLQQLRHKNLPRVLEQFVLDRNGRVLVGDEHDRQEKTSLRYYTVMEFVEGEDLGKMLLRNPAGFAEAKVVSWGIEIATVLYYLHSQKPPIIFRDLKPSNIMISRGQVKLIDFGIARRFDAFKKKDTMRIGSPGYAPPEQYSGQTDRRSDIYALGVTLHQLLTGRDPSETQTPFKLPSVRALKPAVSQATEAIVVQATELDPQARFKTALEMKRSLQAVLGVQSQPLPARPAASPGPSTVVPRVSAPPAPAAAPVPPTLGPPAVAPAPPAPRAQNPYARSAGAPPAAASSPYAKTTATPAPATPAGATPTVAPIAAAAPTAAEVQKAGTPPAAPPVMPHNLPHNAPAAPRPARASRAPFLFILAVLAMFGYRYHDDLTTFGRWLYSMRPNSVSTQPSPAPSDSPPPSPSPSPTPTPAPTGAVERALSLLQAGRTEQALDAVEAVRRREPANPLALLVWNDALVRAQARTAGFPVDVVQVVFVDDAVGNEWLRGVVLAQHEVNAAGGVQGHRIELVPFAVAEAAALDPAAAAAAAQQAKAVAALVDLPGERLSAVVGAYDGARIPLLTRALRGEASDGATGPTFVRVGAALVAAVADIKPKSTALVATPQAPQTVVRGLEAELRKRGGALGVFRDGGEHISEVAAVHPDLVIFLGDARSLEGFAARMRGAQMTAAVLAGPTLETPTGSALLELARQGRLWSVTPYRPTGGAPDQEHFQSAYGRVFSAQARAGYGAAQGYQMLRGLLARLDLPDAQWTAPRVRASLDAGTAVSADGFSGTSVGPARAGAGPWAVVHYKDGAPTLVREVAP